MLRSTINNSDSGRCCGDVDVGDDTAEHVVDGDDDIVLLLLSLLVVVVVLLVWLL